MEKIVINGHERFLGLLPTPIDTRNKFKAAAEVVPVIPEKDWTSLSQKHFVTKILDQDGLSSCTGHSGVQALMIARARQGLNYVELSGSSLYSLINGGLDRGSSLGDALLALKETGACSAKTIGQLDWRAAYKSTAWHVEAANYRIDEAWACSTVEEFVSALILGFSGQMALYANNSFTPDANGFVPGSRGSLNHALCASGILIDSKGRPWIESENSWGDWGPLHGIFYYPVDYLQPEELWICRTSVVI